MDRVADSALAARHRAISDAALERFREIVVRLYFHTPIEKLADLVQIPGREKEIEGVVQGRMLLERNRVVPWLHQAGPLAGTHVLEIGCGAGSSTLAIAEQGAHVLGVDIHSRSLEIARARCEAYGVDNVEFYEANAADLPEGIRNRHFDWIIFFASLEHMTYDERIASLSAAWDMLSPGGLLCCVDTPNRLWYLDGHTAHLPFFFWLPDELAVRYARFSSRQSLKTSMGKFRPNSETILRLIRTGRGCSFHEFDLAIKPVAEMKVVSCLDSLLYDRVTAETAASPGPVTYVRSLMAIAPDIHPAWFFNSLDLILEKT